MPYSSPSEVPKNVPEGKRSQFMSVFNSVYSKTKDEGQAMSAAYSAIKKAQYANDVFTTQQEAILRSRDMGLGGRVHAEQYNNQAVYLPGVDTEEYLEYYEPEYEEDDEDEKFDRMEALRTVIQEILKFEDWGEPIAKAEYQGETVELNKPRRLRDGNKKFEVFVRDGDKVKRVTFGDPNMEIRRDDPEARASFRARHSCDTAKDKTSARYWSCRMWEKDTTVSEATKSDNVSVGDRVSWGSSGGTVRGIVRSIVRNGEVTGILGDNKITGTEEEPAARIELLDDEGKPRDEFVGHKLSTLRKSDLEGQVLKLDEEQRLVYGWASVVTEKGEPVVDRQGDVIKPETLVTAVNKFMEHVRVGKSMHDGEQIGVVVHSWPVTDEISKSVGIQSDREGWLVSFKVYDEAIWTKVKSGELAAFSIGGRAKKEEYNA